MSINLILPSKYKWTDFSTSFPEYHGRQAALIGSLRVLIEYLEDVTGTTASVSPLLCRRTQHQNPGVESFIKQKL